MAAASKMALWFGYKWAFTSGFELEYRFAFVGRRYPGGCERRARQKLQQGTARCEQEFFYAFLRNRLPARGVDCALVSGPRKGWPVFVDGITRGTE